MVPGDNSPNRRAALFLLFGALGTAAAAATPRRKTAREVVQSVFEARPPLRADLSAADLSELDLSQIGFNPAVLRRANLFGADLTHSNLDGADLAGARLDRAVILGTSFAGAQMQNVSLLRPSVFSELNPNSAEAPVFRNADLTSATILARLDGADFGTQTSITRDSRGPPICRAFARGAPGSTGAG